MELKKMMQARELLQKYTYDELNKEDEILVAEYETEKNRPIIEKLVGRCPLPEVEEFIHDMWLDFEISNSTETNLLNYAKSLYKRRDVKL